MSANKKRKLTDQQIKKLFTEDEWNEMRLKFMEAETVAPDSPAKGYVLYRQIVRKARVKIGNDAERILAILAREV